ncbi:MAG: phospholipase D-like domain-containing protein [Terriglobales bacterium]
MAQHFLISNEQLTVADGLSHLANKADKIYVGVAYLSCAEPVASWLKRGVPVRLVVALQPPTDPRVIRSLVSSFPIELEAKFYSDGFHSKLFIFFRKGKPFSAQVGSSNLTGGGLHSNLETNVILGEPKQLKDLAGHFNNMWENGGVLEPADIDRYQERCDQIAQEIVRINQKQRKGRIIRPKVSGKTGAPKPTPRPGGTNGPILPIKVCKEARDYLQFWKSVDDVVKTIEPVSRQEFPKMPLYLSVDHFWHWVVRVWDQKGLNQIASNPKTRADRLPSLFEEYAAWYKGSPGYESSVANRNSNHLRKILAKNRLHALTKPLARSAYREELQSARMRAKRFGADKTFIISNSLSDIKRAFNYLLWSEDDIPKRISSLLPRGPYHLKEFGKANVQELIGWVRPDEMPIRNNKADKAVEMLGYRFR